jgi:hypothetical protein
MRVSIFVLGLIVLVICVVINLGNIKAGPTARTPVPWGYFLVVAAAFLATALYREDRPMNPTLNYQVYRCLAAQPLSFDDLIEKVRHHDPREDPAPPGKAEFHAAIAMMLESGHLEVKNGIIHLALPNKSTHPTA